MKIKFITIENYRCHHLIREMPIHDLTTIIGENDSGKTSVIDFLEIMLTSSIPKESDYYTAMVNNSIETEKEIIGTIKFDLDDNEKVMLKDYLDDNDNCTLKKIFNKDSNKTYTFSRKYEEDRLYMYQNMKAEQLKELLVDLDIPEQKTQDLRKEAVKEHILETELPFKYDWIEIQFLKIRNFLPRFIRYNVDDYKNPNNLVLKTLQEVFENEIYEKSENGIKSYKNNSLKVIMEQVQDSVISATKEFKKYVQKFNDKIVDVTIEPDIDLSSGLKYAPIMIKDESGIFQYIDNRGYGTKKRIFMAIIEWTRNIVSSNIPVIRCYDEPDNNLHIDAQRKLYKTIKSSISDADGSNQIIICTHSLFMIDSAPANSINLFRRNDLGSTEIEYLSGFGDSEVQNFIEHMCREMGLSNSHIFFEKCFIVVEGQSEINFLPLAYKKIFNSSMAEDGITLVNLEGNGSAVNFLKLLMKNKRELTLVFLDNDTTNVRKEKVLSMHNKIVDSMNKEEYENFIKEFFDSKVIFIGEKEFEDTFSDEYLVSVLNTFRKKKDENKWTIEEIKTIRGDKKFSESITKLVAEKSNQYISKPELGILLGENITKNEVPLKVNELFEKARVIANIE